MKDRAISPDLQASFLLFVVSLLIGILTYFGTGEISRDVTRQYKIVDVVDGTGTGKYPRLEWIWSIQYLDDNTMEDRRVSFTEFRIHKIGDVLTETRTRYSDWFLAKLLAIAMSILFCIATLFDLLLEFSI